MRFQNHSIARLCRRINRTVRQRLFCAVLPPQGQFRPARTADIAEIICLFCDRYTFRHRRMKIINTISHTNKQAGKQQRKSDHVSNPSACPFAAGKKEQQTQYHTAYSSDQEKRSCPCRCQIALTQVMEKQRYHRRKQSIVNTGKIRK
mgnify:CR=1 FL=1